MSFCLSQYPAYADRLRPLLEAAATIKQVPPPVARAEAVTRGRERMMAALEAKKAASSRSRGFFAGLSLRLFHSGSPLLRGAVLATLALIIVAGALLLDVGPMPWRPRWAAAQAVLTDVDGRVLLLPSGSRTWLPAFDGDAIEVGDRVRVSGDAQARLAFADGSSSELLRDAELAMVRMAASPQDATPNVVFQESGEARYLVSDRGVAAQVEREEPPADDERATFEVQTPAAVTKGSKGIFSLSVAPDGATTVRGEEGVFTVTAGDIELVLAAGDVTTVDVPPAAAQPGDVGDVPTDLTEEAPSDEAATAESAVSKDEIELTGTLTPSGTEQAGVPTSAITSTVTPTSTTSATPSPTSTATSTPTPEPLPTRTPEPADPQAPPATELPPPATEPPPEEPADDDDGDNGEWDPPGLDDKEPPGLDDKGGTPPGQDKGG